MENENETSGLGGNLVRATTVVEIQTCVLMQEEFNCHWTDLHFLSPEKLGADDLNRIGPQPLSCDGLKQAQFHFSETAYCH